MRRLSLVLVLAFAAASLVALPSNAVGTPNSTGYVWHMGGAAGGQLMRYNLVEGVDEVIDTSDPSCANLSLTSVADLEVDSTNQHVYWVSGYSRLARMNLRTGICQEVAVNDGRNPNNKWVTWRGIDIDEARGVLFLVDNQAYPEGAQTENLTLQYIKLADVPAVGAVPGGLLQVINLSKAAGENTDINFANDITLEGDFAVITGKNTDSAMQNGLPEGDALFLARVFDPATRQVVSSTESVKIFSLVTPATNVAQIVTSKIHNGFLYFSTYNWRLGGVHKVDIAQATPGNPVTMYTSVIENSASQNINWGFDFGDNDVLFTTDNPAWPEPWAPKLIWVDGTQTGLTGGDYLDAFSDSSNYAQIQFNKTAGPVAPSLTQALRDEETSATLTFTAPADAGANSKYTWTATGSDSSTVTGTCTSSPCQALGLTSGVTYSFKLRQVWTNGQTEVIRSLASSAVNQTLPVVNPPTPKPFKSVVKNFAGFETMKSSLTSSQRKAVKTWVVANSGAKSVSCVGYVGHNWKGVSSKALRDLGMARAKAICAYAKTVKPSLKVLKTTAVVTDSKNGGIRRVAVTLK